MISPAAAELIRRAREQVLSGVGCVHREEFDMARVWFAAANASLDALHALLDEPDRRPMRRMALVCLPPQDSEEKLPAWMNHRANDSGDK